MGRGRAGRNHVVDLVRNLAGEGIDSRFRRLGATTWAAWNDCLYHCLRGRDRSFSLRLDFHRQRRTNLRNRGRNIGRALRRCHGASLAFLVARYFLRHNIEELTKRNPRFRAIDEAIGKNGWKIIGLLRLSPLVPFNVSNYFFGITSVSFPAYVLVSAIGMIPGVLLYAYLGAIGQAGVSGGTSQHNIWQYVLLAVGLLATIAVAILVSRIARAALKKSGAVG
jgi:hypothetical protein